MKLQESIQAAIEAHNKYITRLKETETIVKELNLPDLDNYSCYAMQVDLDNPTREQVNEFRRAFPPGTIWDKYQSGSTDGGINYSTTYKGITSRAWNTPPPPSCKIVYEEFFVPGHIERKAVVKCTDENIE